MAADAREPPALPRRIVDAHHHLWRLGSGLYPWLEGPMERTILGDYAAIRRDFDEDRYRAAIGDVPVVASVHVEAGASDPVLETAWLAGDDAGHAWRPDAYVVGCDLCRPDAIATIDRQMDMSAKVRSVRTLGLGRERMFADAGFRANVAQLSRRGLRLDFRVTPADLRDAALIARENPDLPIVVDHLGMPIDRTIDGLALWRNGLDLMAACPNVHLKLSGAPMTDPTLNEQTGFLVREAVRIFSCSRVMFGSNFPVDGLFVQFSELVMFYALSLGDLENRNIDSIFYKNSLEFYGINIHDAPPDEKCSSVK